MHSCKYMSAFNCSPSGAKKPTLTLAWSTWPTRTLNVPLILPLVDHHLTTSPPGVKLSCRPRLSIPAFIPPVESEYQNAERYE
jgi:hypothetical protein